VPEPKHRAAKAGRFVRAVGLGIQREIEKRADAPKPAPARSQQPPRKVRRKKKAGRR